MPASDTPVRPAPSHAAPPAATTRPLAPAPLAIDLGDARDRLVGHRLYALVNSPERLRAFMAMHVFAVWDFQSLLKAMQQRLTCTTVPWLPTADPEARRLVNEIVLEEESDELPDGGHASHFELYLESMKQAGAEARPIERLLALLGSGAPLPQALVGSGAHPAAAEFVRKSFDVIGYGETHRIVAAFTYGREDVIPDMFRNLVVQLSEADPARWSRFRFYLERHIEHDDEKHAPICRRILARQCGDDPRKWAEASETARGCLEARITLWDAIAEVFGG